MAKRNLTVQLEEDLIRRAKVIAATRGTSVSGLVAREIEELVNDEARYRESRARASRALARAVPRGGRTWLREDLHEG